jgi:hypothetical protein
MLDGLKCADGFTELLARLGVFNCDVERALHAADHFRGERGGGDVEGAFEIGGGADFFGGRVIGEIFRPGALEFTMNTPLLAITRMKSATAASETKYFSPLSFPLAAVS